MGRAVVGCWLDFPGLHVEVSLGKILNPKTAPDVLVGTLHGSHGHQCMNYCQSLWTKASAKCPKCKCLNVKVHLH